MRKQAKIVEPIEDMPEDIPEGIGRVQGVASGNQIAPFGLDQETERQIEAEDQVAAILAELGDQGTSASVSIRRQNPKTKEFEYLRSVEAVEFASSGIVEFIANEFGGGLYECFVYSPSPNKRIVGRPKIRIADDVRPRHKEQSGAVPVDFSPIARLAETMQQGFQQLATLIAQTVNNRPSEKEFLEKMVIYKNLFADQSSKTDRLSDLRAMAEFFRELQPRDGEPGLADMAMKFLDTFKEPLTKLVTEKAAQVVPASNTVALAPSPGTVSATTPQTAPSSQPHLDDEQMFQITMLRYYLGLILKQAEIGTAPEHVAQYVLDNVPPAVLDELIEKGDLVDTLATVNPDVNKWRPWFEKIRDIVIASAYEPDEENPKN